jgi:hypothetical protein
MQTLVQTILPNECLGVCNTFNYRKVGVINYISILNLMRFFYFL